MLKFLPLRSNSGTNYGMNPRRLLKVWRLKYKYWNCKKSCEGSNIPAPLCCVYCGCTEKMPQKLHVSFNSKSNRWEIRFWNTKINNEQIFSAHNWRVAKKAIWNLLTKD